MLLNTICIIPANAQYKDLNSAKFYCDGNGKYVMINVSSYSQRLNNDEDIIEALPTDSEEIFALNQNEYLIRAYDNVYFAANKISISGDFAQMSKALENSCEISDTLLADIDENITREQENENPDFEVELYVPTGVTTNSTNSNEFTYNGHKLRHYLVNYKNCSTGMKEKNGTKTKDFASALVDFVISCVGCASATVSLFGAGKSALSVFTAAYGQVTVGSQDDRINTNLIYDKTTKEIQYYNPISKTWDDGCFTRSVTFTRNDTYQFYSSNGNSLLKQTSLNKAFYSEHYYDYQFAVETSPVLYIDDYIYATLYGNKIRLWRISF